MKKEEERTAGDVGVDNLKEVNGGHRGEQFKGTSRTVEVAEQAGIQHCFAEKPAEESGDAGGEEYP